MNTVISEEIDCSLHLPTFSPDGSKIAAMVANKFIYVWETCSGCLLTQSPALKNSMHIQSLVLSLDGNQLLIHTRDYWDYRWHQGIWIWMWQINEEDNCVIKFDHDNWAVFFPNTSQIVTMSSEPDALWIWDMESTP
jgi:hypothetical protein